MSNEADGDPVNLGLYRILKKKKKNLDWFHRKNQELDELQANSISVEELKDTLNQFPPDARISFIVQGEQTLFFKIKNLVKGPKNIIMAFLKSEK